MLLDLRSVWEAAAPTGGGMFKGIWRWQLIAELRVFRHGYRADDWFAAALAAGMTPAEAVLMLALAEESAA